MKLPKGFEHMKEDMKVKGIKRIPFFCSFYNEDCKYDECPAFYSSRERTQREIEELNMSDIPVIGRFVAGEFCTKFGNVEHRHVIEYETT